MSISRGNIRYYYLLLLVGLILTSGCEQLDLGNVGGTDDDISVIRAKHNGYYYMAFISDRGQPSVPPDPPPAKIWIARSPDGAFGAQTEYVQITSGTTSFDVYPTIVQTDDNCFHLTWSQLTSPTASRIYYTHTCDVNGLIWNNPRITIGGPNFSDGQGPKPVADGNDLLLYATSANFDGSGYRRIYVLQGTRNFNWVQGLYWTWSEPAVISSLVEAPKHDWFPAVAAINGVYWMVFQRSGFDNAFGENPQSGDDEFDVDVRFALSVDGLNWTHSGPVTQEPQTPHLWPALNYAPTLNQWLITLTSGVRNASGGFDGIQVFLKLEDVMHYDARAVDVTPIIGPGWGMRMAPSPQGKTLSFWVNKPGPTILPQVFSGEF